ATPVDTNAQQQYNYKGADVIKFQNTLQQVVKEQVDVFKRLDTAQELMEEEIEIATQRLTDCLMAATREAVLVRNWSHHSKPWWTKEVKESLKRVKELDEESKDCYQRFRQVDFDLENRLAEAKKEFKCKCKKAKRDDTNKKLEEAGK
ncbi:hypothetical protein FRB93_002395, partial [Tulasnella sp. JGI-2019a]